MFCNQTKCLTLLCVLYVVLVQYVNFSYVLFLLHLHCCADCMDYLGQVLVLYAAFLCLSDRLMLHITHCNIT